MDGLMISIDTTIKEAIKRLDEVAKKILIVLEHNIVVGVITDGDIRRWILKNGSLDELVTKIMNSNPYLIYRKDKEQAKKLMIKKGIQAVPVVDYKRHFVDIIFWEDTFEKEFRRGTNLCIPVVIMAGGKGTRLYPYTQVLPKPLIPIGEQTILERIINQFNQIGCKEFYLTVNYKKNMLKSYMEDIKKDYIIKYIEEEQFLGTAGSLFLLKGQLEETFFVSNCDILVDADYEAIYRHHKENNYQITMVTSLKNYTIPYGVIRSNNIGCIDTIEEKPEYNFQVNTGLYMLEPEVLEDVPENTFFHITDLINEYIKEGKKVGVYPVMENQWMDMGEIKEMQSMLKRLDIEM